MFVELLCVKLRREKCLKRKEYETIRDYVKWNFVQFDSKLILSILIQKNRERQASQFENDRLCKL